MNSLPADYDYASATKETALWGTYGKSGSEPLRWVRLVDCETDHLLAIVRTQPQLPAGYLAIIHDILADRGLVLPAPRSSWVHKVLQFSR